VREATLLLILSLLRLAPAIAQSPNATINGIVVDPSGAAIAGAEIIVVSDATRIQYVSRTSAEGVYVVSNLPPGTYRLQVSKVGFKTLIKPGIIVNLQDALAITFTLPIGAVSEIVTITGGAPLVNTQSAAVNTVIDHTYVENMPLNGRSFQDLILLTPGVVTATPQNGAFTGIAGEFSVNGQRTESNYYTVDGVSANTGLYPGGVTRASTSGSLPASTALGTTQGLVSVDALEEFRVQSSTYSAEYGRSPGGQFDFVTRSGTNQWHGTAFDYLRNDAFDANDWFNGFFGQPKSPLRQNDFGGTLGGPVTIPHLYRGQDRTFFFFSYEGLRLLQPQAANITYVPDSALRQSAPAALQPVLNAFPVANGPDQGNGLAEFIGAWSNPSQIDATSVRLDHSVSQKLKLFFRFSDTSSNATNRSTAAASNLSPFAFTTRTYTFGAVAVLSSRWSNELRLNYSSNAGTQSTVIDDFKGAKPVNLAQLQGIDSGDRAYAVSLRLGFPGYFVVLTQGPSVGVQRQWNLADALNLALGHHRIKVGIDYRRLAPLQQEGNPTVNYDFVSANSVQGNSPDVGSIQNFAPAYPLYHNYSAFGQDEWRFTPRLNISAGVRWEINPAPGAETTSNLPYTILGNLAQPSSWSLAPQGTPLWKTTWHNFGPRLGATYVLRDSRDFETVVRGGAGIFFDTGQQNGSWGYEGPNFQATAFFGSLQDKPVSFPVPLAQFNPSFVNPPSPPFALFFVNSPNLQLPYTIQWNVSIEQAMGGSQALTVSYVGANGRRLLEENELHAQPVNPNFGYVFLYRNGLTSDYDSLQVKFQRRLSQGLTALGSYTWSHAIDYGSQNAAFQYIRGNSDYDVRHNFSGAFSYELPNAFKNSLARALSRNWSIDDRLTARTGFPVALDGSGSFDPATGSLQYTGLDIVPGQPIYIHGAQCPVVSGSPCPGGRAINVKAFAFPAAGQFGDAPRNFARGFGAWQMDTGVRRRFVINERLSVLFRTEAFNVLNHPNFGQIFPFFFPGSTTFGKPTATLAQSLGGLSPLYQLGGPRSLQFSLKLNF
jgi:hypothetical protein